MEIYGTIASSCRAILSSQIHETAGCEARNLGNLLHFHRQVHSGHYLVTWNFMFHGGGCAEHWIDRCIKQPSKPITNGTNASKGRKRPASFQNLATPIVCFCIDEA